MVQSSGASLALAFVLSLFAGASGCAGERSSTPAAPEAALRAFHDALRSGDAEGAFAYLTDDVREVLGVQSRAWLAQTGEERAPSSFLLAAWAPGEADIRSVERVRATDSETVLRVETYMGEEGEVVLVRSASGWRVRIAEVEEGRDPMR